MLRVGLSVYRLSEVPSWAPHPGPSPGFTWGYSHSTPIGVGPRLHLGLLAYSTPIGVSKWPSGRPSKKNGRAVVHLKKWPSGRPSQKKWPRGRPSENVFLRLLAFARWYSVSDK